MHAQITVPRASHPSVSYPLIKSNSDQDAYRGSPIIMVRIRTDIFRDLMEATISMPLEMMLWNSGSDFGNAYGSGNRL